MVDGNRLAIRGWSASGYTTLAALTFRDVFKAGASHFGISDLEAMAKETHKFESRYLDRLVAPFPSAGATSTSHRSPIHFVDRLSCPLILFQGLEDAVVPPNQAQMMYDAVKAKGLPVALVMFEGEQHGFRRAENIRRALDGELYFLSRVFGFELAGSDRAGRDRESDQTLTREILSRDSGNGEDDEMTDLPALVRPLRFGQLPVRSELCPWS